MESDDRNQTEIEVHLAVDLGAGSGRVMAARVGSGTFELEEIHRFENRGLDLPGGNYWNLPGLFSEILHGIRLAANRHGSSLRSIGIDTWGCDYAILDRHGELLAMPHQYRDPRHEGMAEVMHGRMSEAEIFRHTGIATHFYNSSLHLLSEQLHGATAVEHGRQLLFVPDLLAYWLSGIAGVELTVASTSQLLDPRSRDWALPVIDALELPRQWFGRILPPASVLGPMRDSLAAELGMKPLTVVTTASHDTAAAVAGIPIDPASPLWLSSGTWSILGLELNEPVTSAEALAAGFCNELGMTGQVRFLKNIAGLWLIQECRRHWATGEGTAPTYAELAELARAAEPFQAMIDPDAPEFSAPGDMPGRIRSWCRAHGQPEPATHGALLRVITESLAMKYRLVYEDACALSGRKFTKLHLGGGGMRNELLCQATADALGIPVLAGPVEATACGNVLGQLLALGEIPDLAAGRALIAQHFPAVEYLPQDAAAWHQPLARFRELMAQTTR